MLGKPSILRRRHLEKSGTRASAVVLEISTRGPTVTTGNQAAASSTEVVLKTRLRVEPVGAPPFEVQKHFRYGQFSRPPVGMRLNVIYDPDEHDHIMLERPESADSPFGKGGMELGGGGNLAGMLSTLQALKQAQAGNPGDAQALGAALGKNPTVLVNGVPTGDPVSQADPVEQLTQLAELRDRGALTETEFEAQKARILSGRPTQG